MDTKLDTMAERESYVDRLRNQRDAVIAERAHYGDMMRAKLGQCENERDALRGKVELLRAACDNVAGNMERTGMWSDWHNQVAVSILRNAYNATA